MARVLNARNHVFMKEKDYLKRHLKLYIAHILNYIMKNISESDILENFDYWRRAVVVSNFKEILRPQIFKETGDTSNNEYVISVLKFLEDNDFIDVDRGRTPHLIKVNTTKLSTYLRDGFAFNLSEILIKQSNNILSAVFY